MLYEIDELNLYKSTYILLTTNNLIRNKDALNRIDITKNIYLQLISY